MDTYINTLIMVADDSPVAASVVPMPRGGKPTVASIQYALLAERPYALTQGDVLLAISTSGTSNNVIKAAEVAIGHGMKVISLTGRPHSALGALAEYDICTPAGEYADRVQELHIKVIHILVELVERALFPENY